MFLRIQPYKMRYVHLLLTLFALPVSAQQATDFSSVLRNETILRNYFISLQSSSDDVEKDSINTAILDIFSTILAIPESFFYTWPELDMIGKIKSDDMLVNIFTWHAQKSDNEYKYYGIIQHRTPGKKNDDILNIFLLNDVSTSLKNPEKSELSHDNWYGALYYSMTTNHFRRKTWYALLGFDFNSRFSNKKIIEILHFDHDKPVFGDRKSVV